jgi:hypothetical protein
VYFKGRSSGKESKEQALNEVREKLQGVEKHGYDEVSCVHHLDIT